MLRAFKYRLYPTKPQLQDLEKTLMLCRRLYNAALQERRDAYKKAGKTVGFYEQKRHLPKIRAELPEYKSIHSQVLQNVVERVDKAFQGFFRRVKEGEKPGYPRFKGKGRYDSFTFPQASATGVKLQKDGKRVLIYGVGSVRCKFHRPLEGKLKTATIKREGEHWYIVFVCEVEPRPLPQSTEAIGIDLGTNPNFLITSDGEMVQAPRYFQKSQAKLAAAQRSLARKKRGSRRREQARRRVVKVDPKHTSQDCPVCGHRRKHPLWIRVYSCPQCGTLLHRDVAAAQNIRAMARTEPSGTGTARAVP